MNELKCVCNDEDLVAERALMLLYGSRPLTAPLRGWVWLHRDNNSICRAFYCNSLFYIELQTAPQTNIRQKKKELRRICKQISSLKQFLIQ